MQNPLIGNYPDLKVKYAVGLGDIVACFLHSRLMHNVTVLITGSDKPCMACSARRNAMNLLFPIPFWRLFFRTKEELLETLAADYRASGYKVEIDKNTGKLSVSKSMTVENK
jgi:hypothetical protein